MIPNEHTYRGGVPGGHNALSRGDGKPPFVPPMRECHSVPLLYTDVVVDIGAYVGAYALTAARFPVLAVTAYEPTPETFEVLAFNAASLPNLELVQGAVVGDDSTSVDLFVSAGIGVTNSIAKSYRKDYSIRVPAIPYKNAVRGASVVKIDVEGAEYDYDDLVQSSIRALLIDFHPVAGDRDFERARETVKELAEEGFEAIITPDFESGWTCAGSWVREVEIGEDVFVPMIEGALCCGCGAALRRVGTKALCGYCYRTWKPRHRRGFDIGALA